MRYKIIAGNFNLLYESLDDCKDAIKRFHLTHYKVVDCLTNKTCFHS